MKRVVLLSAGTALALSLAACERSAAPADGSAVPAAGEASVVDAEAVKKAFAAFNAAIVAKDVDAIKSHYANDAVMVIPDMAPFEGLNSIMSDYKNYAADAAGKYVPGAETTTVSPGGDTAIGEVKYQSTFTNPKTKVVETANRYNLSLYRKQPDGSWKIVRDINVNLPKAG